MALRILLVDPSPEWLDASRAFLKSYGYEIDIVSNGKDAQLSLYKNQYFGVVLNLGVLNFPGIQVLNYILSSKVNITIIATLPENGKLEDFDLSENKIQQKKVSDVLIKPFTSDDLLKAIEGQHDFSHIASRAPMRAGASQEEEVSEDDDKFTRIKIDEFFSSKSVLFNVYIKLNSGRYVKILNGGDTFDAERIKKYKDEKKVEYLYFSRRDNHKFLRLQNFLTEKLVKNENVSAEKKITFVKNAGEKFVDAVFTEGFKPQLIEEGHRLCENVLQLAKSEPNIAKALNLLGDLDPSRYSHSFLVSFFSTMLANKFSWGSKVITELVGLGSLLHDIGFVKLPPEIAQKNKADYTPEERKIYETHPTLGAELVEGSKAMPSVVKQIILQHHELSDGKGFPNRLSGHKILAMSKIISFCDDYCHILTDQKKKPLEAIRYMLKNQEATIKHPSVIIEKFVSLFVDENTLKKNKVSK